MTSFKKFLSLASHHLMDFDSPTESPIRGFVYEIQSEAKVGLQLVVLVESNAIINK